MKQNYEGTGVRWRTIISMPNICKTFSNDEDIIDRLNA